MARHFTMFFKLILTVVVLTFIFSGVTNGTITTDETIEGSAYESEEDITEIAGATDMSTQPEAAHDETIEGSAYESEEDITEIAGATDMSTQPEATHDETIEGSAYESEEDTTQIAGATDMSTEQEAAHDERIEGSAYESEEDTTQIAGATDMSTQPEATHGETTEGYAYESEEDTTQIAGATDMSTQPEATHDCGTVTSQEALSSSQGDPLGVRLDGIKDVVKGSAPWIARLYKHERDIICGGALIDSQWVVTAASCFHGNDQPVKQDFSIRIGDHNGLFGEFIGIEETYEHEDFVLSSFNNDIALIKLVSPLRRYTDYIKPICLANETKYRALVTGGALGRVTKWHLPTEVVAGATGKLIEAYVPFVGYQFCKRYFRQRSHIFTKNMFCAGYSLGWTDACFGERGGPYSVKDETGRWYMTGLLSKDLEYCREHTYGIYTKYPKYNEWVQKTIAKFG